jgi:fructokinase
VQAREQGVPVSYDPNLRPGHLGADPVPRVREVAKHADVVKLSEDDARLLDASTEPGATASSLLGSPTTLVVLTRGPAGATAFTPEGWLDVPAIPVQVVDTVGAGDAFMAGLISAADLPLPARLTRATTWAAACCRRTGAW